VNISLGLSSVLSRLTRESHRQAYAPILLERKATAIRRTMDVEKAFEVVTRTSVETGDRRYVCLIFVSFHTHISGSWKWMFSKALVRPFKLFVHEPIVQLLGLYMAFVYGLLYSTCLGPPRLYGDSV
jgi:hypothetical protein